MTRAFRLLCTLLAAASLGMIVTAALAQDFGNSWQPLPVPGAWEDVSKGSLAKYDGHAWYRCWV
ncbi:MAG: hypothetical protein L0215_05815, partial [Gemmataceae bacterium]|nr:hypothetical protein [Gemmataceae bacterium]